MSLDQNHQKPNLPDDTDGSVPALIDVVEGTISSDPHPRSVAVYHSYESTMYLNTLFMESLAQKLMGELNFKSDKHHGQHVIIKKKDITSSGATIAPNTVDGEKHSTAAIPTNIDERTGIGNTIVSVITTHQFY